MEGVCGQIKGMAGARGMIISTDEAAKVTNTDQFFYLILEGFAKDCILGRVQGDMSDVDFEVLVRVCFANIAVQSEGFPLGRKRGVGDKVNEGVTTSRLVGREQIRWDGMVDHSGEGGGKVVRGDVGC